MDDSFNLVDSLLPAYGYPTDIHEFLILQNGNYLFTATTTSTADLSGHVFNGNPGSDQTTLRNYVIQEFENGTSVFNWNSIDHIHAEQFVDGFPYNPTDFDHVHGNAVVEDPDENLLVSMRHTDAVYKIDRSTGNLIWTLGGIASDFSFINDDVFSGQHDIRLSDNGNLTLFDNGNSKPTPQVTLAAEYELDESTMTATRVWEYSDEDESYARAMGSFRTSSNGEKIIGYGFCNRPTPNFIHLNPQDEMISELLFQDSVVSYRAVMETFSFEPSKPEISCSFSNNVTVLSAPSGYSSYVWNTGEQTQHIAVTTPGTYQVWTNLGVGMIGSEPFFLTDSLEPCSLTAVAQFEDAISATQVIRFYPNLNQIEVLAPGSVTILNSIGQLVLKTEVSNTRRLNISNQVNGVFLVVLETESGDRSVRRFLKL